MNELSDEDLVKKAKKSPEAFGRLYDRYYAKIYRYVLRRTANVHAALDITSTVFLKSLIHMDSYEWREFPFSSWLYKIASNEIVDYFSKKRHASLSLEKLMDEKGFEPQDIYTLEEEIQKREEELLEHVHFIRLQKIISKLPIADQEIISLRFFEKKKTREIAEITGKKEGTIKSQLSRLLDHLRKEVLKEENFLQPFPDMEVVLSEEKVK